MQRFLNILLGLSLVGSSIFLFKAYAQVGPELYLSIKATSPERINISRQVFFWLSMGTIALGTSMFYGLSLSIPNLEKRFFVTPFPGFWLKAGSDNLAAFRQLLQNWWLAIGCGFNVVLMSFFLMVIPENHNDGPQLYSHNWTFKYAIGVLLLAVVLPFFRLLIRDNNLFVRPSEKQTAQS